MGFKNRNAAMFMVICIFLSMFSGIVSADGIDGGALEEIPGALILDKTTNHVPDTDIWEITVSLNGLDRITSSDVVLVIDKSGSMAGTKMTNTKAAANAFVENLLKDDNSNTRIAIVTFNGTAQTVQTFTKDKATLKTAISSISTDGGTNIQGGLKHGNDLLSSSQANNKYIVLLGDGAPTYTYAVTGIDGLTIASHTGSTPNFVLDDGYTATFDYNKRAGNGSVYELYGGNWITSWDDRSNVSIPCSTHGSHTYRVENNGFATIAEANAAKKNGIEIYTVALDAGTDGQIVLNKCANAGNYYQMNNNNAAGLTQAFVEIAGKIAFAATDVVINDPMGEMFTLDPTTIVFKMGGVPYTPDSGDFQLTSVDGRDGQKIIWKIPSVENASSPITLTYTVKIEQDVNPRTNFKTNGETTVDYLDVDGKLQHREFFVPEVNSGDYGTILINYYLVNENGEALNAQGNPVKEFGEIHFLYQEYFAKMYDTEEHPEGELLTSHNGTHEITAPETMELTKYNGEKVTGIFEPGNSNNYGNGSPIEVTVDVANQQRFVYFAYKVQDTFNVKYHENAGPEQTVSNMPANLTGVIPGTKITEPSEPTSDGYEFGGWYSDSNGDLKWIFDTDKVNTNINLYAKWTYVGDREYTVSFNADGGTPEPEAQIIKHGNSALKPTTDPSKEGYDFTGWKLGEENYDFNTKVVGNIELKAGYKTNDSTFQVTFDADGGTPAPEAQTVKINGLAVKPTTDPSKEGYDFTGWKLGEENYDFNTKVVGNIELKAGYKTNDAKYTVSFDANGGTPEPEDQTVNHNGFATKPADSVKVGHDFIGWRLANANENFDFVNTRVKSNLELVALYETNDTLHTVTFDSAGGSAVPEQKIKVHDVAVQPTPNPTKSGYRFDHWYESTGSEDTAWDFATIIESDMTLVAKWTYTGGNNNNGGYGEATIVEPTENGTSKENNGSEIDSGGKIEEIPKTEEPIIPDEEGHYKWLWWLLLLLLLLLLCYGYYRYRKANKNNNNR